jgi:hypothetical protein
MKSLAGRSNYISQSQLDGVLDPGAFAVATAFSTLAKFYEK